MYLLDSFLLLASAAVASGLAAPRQAGDQYVPTMQEWTQAEEKALEFVSKLNRTEKTIIITGTMEGMGQTGCIGTIRPIERVGFPGLCLLDGPASVNRAHQVSVFPSGVTTGASWDRDLIFQRAVALGEEFKSKGAHAILGPAIGPLGRHPLGGRNWEGFSPDPYLSGEAVKYTVMGHQSVGLQTSTKHYLLNEQETQRTRVTLEDGTVIDAISSNADDRTIHETYLWPFVDAIKAGTTSIMCSYNRVNSTYACEDERLLTEILRKELGFRGFVVSDWFATHSTAESANAGLDMEQPGDLLRSLDLEQPGDLPEGFGGTAYWGEALEAAVEAGNVTEDRLDEMARRVIAPYFLLGQDKGYPTPDSDLPYTFAVSNLGWAPELQLGAVPGREGIQRDHGEFIRKMGASASVLLKNTDGILPLGEVTNIGVFGNGAIEPTDGIAYLAVYESLFGPEYGALSVGGGAGSGRNPYLVSPLDAIKERVKGSGSIVQHLISNKVLAENDFRALYPVPDVCIVFLKTWAEEMHDRPSFENDWNSTLVVENTAAFCRNKTVVVTNSAGVNTMPWAENENVTAILAAHYPGHEMGNSIKDVLFGDVEPSGRLPYTIPKKEEDYDFAVVNLTDANGNIERNSEKWQAEFSEGALIDYRHFDRNDIEPQFEFGFGLGFTTFELAPEVSVNLLKKPLGLPDPQAAIEPGGNVDLWTELITVSATVKNTGSRKGSTVVQLYLSLPEYVTTETTPAKVLRGFEKLVVEAGEEREVEFRLQRRDVSYWDVEVQEWRIPEGQFTARIGFSSRDLPAEMTFDILG